MFSKPKTYISNGLYFIKYSLFSGHIFYILVNILGNSNTNRKYLTFGIFFSYLHSSFMFYYMGYSEYQLYLLYFGASCTKYRVFRQCAARLHRWVRSFCLLSPLSAYDCFSRLHRWVISFCLLSPLSAYDRFTHSLH